MPDAWELFFGLNPNDAADAAGDPDGDGLTNAQEFAAHGHPFGRHQRLFAEGSTGFFQTSIGLANPSATETAHVSVVFTTDLGESIQQLVLVGPRQRQTIDVAAALGGLGRAVSTKVESDIAVAADRLMTWGQGEGASLDSGVGAPATTWYLAEGATGPFFLYYLLENPGASVATVTVRYLREGGLPVSRTYQVPPRTRATIPVNGQSSELAMGSLGAAITSDVPIVAERAMYLAADDAPFGAGSAASAVSALSAEWFFAEGATGPFFDEFLALVNPSTTDAATVTVTFHLADGTTLSKAYDVGAEQRRSVWLNLEAEDDPSLQALAATVLWLHVTSTRPIAAERVMWWPHGRPWYESHSGSGAAVPAPTWTVAEGAAGGAAAEQTYVLVANTSATAGRIRLTLVQDGGATATRDLDIGALERLSIDVGAQFGLDAARFSVFVESLGAALPLVVEYARYASTGGRVWSAGGATMATPYAPEPPREQAPSVVATTPASSAIDVAADATLTVTFSEPVFATASAFALACGGAPIALTNVTASPAIQFTLTHASLPLASACTLTIDAAGISDADISDPPDHPAASVTVTFTIVGCPTIGVTPNALADGVAGVAYGPLQFVQTGGAGAIAWSISAGALPTGLALLTSGQLQGTPTAPGTFAFGVTATDANGCTGSVQLALHVVCPTITIDQATLGPWSVGVPLSQTLTVTGGTGTVTFAVTAGALPAGVSLSANGTLSVSATAAGTFTFTVTATRSTGCSGSRSYSVTILPRAVTDVYPEVVVGNVNIDSSRIGFSVLANDSPGGATITGFDAVTQAGGVVSLNPATGQFVYAPPRGYTGLDKFQYTIGSGAAQSSAEVTLSISGIVWFIDGTAPPGGDGRRNSPYNSLAAFSAANDGVGSNPAAGDGIFIYENALAYAGSVVLLDNQRLVGQDATGTFAQALGITPGGSSDPLPVLSPANAVLARVSVSSGNGITLAHNNIVRGLTVTTGSGTTGIAGAGFGTLTIADVAIAGTGEGVSLAQGALTAVFRSISSAGAVNGIVLADTTGAFTVTGDGTTGGSGGTISSATGPGVLLTNAAGVALHFMTIQNGGDDGIRGSNVAGFTLDRSIVFGNGNAAGEAGLDFINLSGVAAITNAVVTGSAEDNIAVRNSSGSLTLSVSATEISSNSAIGGDGVLLAASATASITATISVCTFTANRGHHVRATAANAAVLDVRIFSNSINSGHPTAVGQGIVVDAATGLPTPYSGQVRYRIQNNTIAGAVESAITTTLGTSAAGATMDGLIAGNFIGISAGFDSCSQQGSGVQIAAHGNGTHTVTIANNTIRQCFDKGIAITANDGNGVLNANVSGNTVQPSDGVNTKQAFFLSAGSTATNVFGVADGHFVCLSLGVSAGSANVLTAGAATPSEAFSVGQHFNTTIRLPGYGGGARDTAAVVSFVSTNNFGASGSATADPVTGGGFVGGAPCATPAF